LENKPQVSGKNLLITIVLNVVITVAQAIGGVLSGSLALLSDALHNFSDVLSLVFSLIANRLATKEANFNQTFGYKRAELIAAFVNAATLIVVALYLIYEAFLRFLHPQVINSDLVIVLSIVGIVANGLSVLILKQDADRNLNMKSAYLHLFTDMMASVAVLIGGILIKFYQIYKVDSILTFSIAVYLILVGYDLLKKSTQMLMLFTPEHIKIEDIVHEVHQIDGANVLHHIHVWNLNEDELHLEAHLDCSENLTLNEFNELLHQIEKVLLEKFGINHVNIQPEFKKPDSKDYIVQD
jgi:cobalt-zinc-cadmium efflux system protein